MTTNINTLTHRVHFRKPGMEPVLLDGETAEKIIKARNSVKYRKDAQVKVAGIQCEFGDLGIIEKLNQPVVKRGFYRCENEKCNNEQRMHREGEHCDYDFTGKCSQCETDVIEKTREYTLYRYGRVLCESCSPFGAAKRLFPPPEKPDSNYSRMIGIAAYYIDKGLSDEEVIEVVSKDLTKRNIGESYGESIR